jgi:hypothetical protein
VLLSSNYNTKECQDDCQLMQLRRDPHTLSSGQPRHPLSRPHDRSFFPSQFHVTTLELVLTSFGRIWEKLIGFRPTVLRRVGTQGRRFVPHKRRFFKLHSKRGSRVGGLYIQQSSAYSELCGAEVCSRELLLRRVFQLQRTTY